MRKIITYCLCAAWVLAVVSCSSKGTEGQNQQGGGKQQGGGQKGGGPGQQGPTPVTLDTVQTGNPVYYDTYPATVTAANEVQIRAQVNGNITGIFFRDGQRVRKGQLLYSIDDQQYRNQYLQAVANTEAAKANEIKAKQDVDKYEFLWKNDAIAKQVLDHAEADHNAAVKQVDAARANAVAVQTALKYSKIYSPINGTIGISQVRIGTPVSAGSVILNTVSQDDPMAVDFNVDQKQIPRFIKLQQAPVQPRDSTFTLMLSDQSIFPYSGRVLAIDRAVDSLTATIKTRIVFPNPGDMLRSGMTVNMRVLNRNAQAQMLIQNKDIVEQVGEYFVFVVNKDKVSQQKITVGQHIGDKIIVTSGLKPGEVIVSEGVQKLKDGSQIKAGGDSTKQQQGGAPQTDKK